MPAYQLHIADQQEIRQEEQRRIALDQISHALFREFRSSPEYEFLKGNDEFREFLEEYRERYEPCATTGHGEP